MKPIRFDLQKKLLFAASLFEKGQLDEAITALHEVLNFAPQSTIAHAIMARAFGLQGKVDEALRFIVSCTQTGALDDGSAGICRDIIRDWHGQSQFVAMEVASQALCTNRNSDGDAWNLLGVACMSQLKHKEALQAFTRAREMQPNKAEILVNLGAVLSELGDLDQAESVLNQALGLQDVAPIRHIAENNLGGVMRMRFDWKRAEVHFIRALEALPDYPEAFANLGLVQVELEQYPAAIENFQRALKVLPNMIRVQCQLAHCLRAVGRLKEAMDCCEAILEMDNELSVAWAVLGDVLRDANHIDESIESFIKAVSYQKDPSSEAAVRVYTSLLFCLNYHPDLDAETIYQAYVDYNQRFCLPRFSGKRSFVNKKDVNKKLRVGYVSQALFNQVCMHFLMPLLENHDPSQVELYAYTDSHRTDAVTERYKKAIPNWVYTKGMSHEEMARRILSDGIDILVDVSGHTTDNRLLAFAYKPAPVTLHWLEFGYTTGLTAMDYYLCDGPTIPEGYEHLFSEKPWRLEGVPYTYVPRHDTGPVGDSPALKNGYVTIGTLSRSIRINHRVIRTWAAILNTVPTAHLVVNSPDFKDVNAQEELASRFMKFGIERERLEIGCTSPPWDVMRGIDIGLDCFPHNSGTTLFETLFMGQPFVTLAGRPSVGRLGASILHGVGHPEWIAYDEEQYVQNVVSLASDIPKLANIRQTLRAELEASPLMDHPKFARSVENAYREMWKIYCEGHAK